MIALLIPIAQVLLALCMILVAILCFRLDRKLAALREGKDGVAAAAGELAAAVARAEASVRALKAVSEDASTELQAKIEEARAASEGLKFLTTAARAVEIKPAAAPAPSRQPQWPEEEFRPARREPASTSKWGGLR